jgi:hypothetical protein
MKLTRLLSIILVTLPLTNSVTVPVGFPLKIYEGVGFVALLVWGLSGPIQLGHYRRIPLLWGVFLFASLFASGWGLYAILDKDTSMLEWAHGRYHPLVNSIFHYSYLAFDIGLLAMFLHAFNKNLITLQTFCRWWLKGSLLAVVYGALLNIVLLLGLPPVVLLRWDKVQFMNVGGLNIARTGPFEEGNYFGFYLLASTIIALFSARKFGDRFSRIMVPILVFGVLITASPAALMGVVAVIFFAVIRGDVSANIKALAMGGAALVLLVLVQTGLFQTLIFDKFSLIFVGGVTDVTNVSLIQRMNESYHAWLMFLDHPYGVGMGNYGYFFGGYPDLYVWLVSDFASFKRIANNVYIEVLCEHGLVVFGLFCYLLYFKARRLLVAREYQVAMGLALMYVYFFAFPTFRLSLIWVFWAFVIYLGQDPKGKHR